MSRELRIQCPDGQMKTIPLTGERLSVGRSSAAEMCFPEDAGLSRQHFAFESQGEDWTVQDLGSKNGTFVNNIPLKARLILKPGDRVVGFGTGPSLVAVREGACPACRNIMVWNHRKHKGLSCRENCSFSVPMAR
jgi:hypothetical protein